MVEDPDLFDHMGLFSDEVGPAFTKIPDAMIKFPSPGEPHQTAYSLWNDTDLPMYQFISDKPERVRRFGQSMKFLTKGGACDIAHLTSNYDWTALDKPGSVLVDVGGGHGAVMQHLADSTKNIRFIVQDLPSTVESGRGLLPDKYRSRIEFASHDFFEDQTIQGKDVYFFRWIFHNLSDQYCVKILQGLIPAMRNGTKILVFEMVLSDRPHTTWTQKLCL